ncbi:hypothetical protein DIPPA_13215 [Diplonema papillatum]|nr:hypothetical protein DIPPA_13215 [Diplonema papillatum]
MSCGASRATLRFVFLLLLAATCVPEALGCPGVYSNTTYLAVTFDCGEALEPGDTCVVQPPSTAVCDGDVICSNSGAYRSTVLCRCRPSEFPLGHVNVSCPEIEHGGALECAATPDANYACEAAQARCGSFLNVSVDVPCVAVCPAAKPVRLYLGTELATVYCDETLLAGQNCTVEYDNDTLQCTGSAACVDNQLVSNLRCRCADACPTGTCPATSECAPSYEHSVSFAADEGSCASRPCHCSLCSGVQCADWETCVEFDVPECDPQSTCCKTGECLQNCNGTLRSARYGDGLSFHCANVAPGQACELLYDPGLCDYTGTALCKAGMSIDEDAVQCELSCTFGELTVFNVSGNPFVQVECRGKMALNEECDLIFDAEFVFCKSAPTCGPSNSLLGLDDVTCSCTNRCTPSLCGDPAYCVPVPKKPDLAADNVSAACPLESMFTCECDPCSSKRCLSPARCYNEPTASCTSSTECCKQAVCKAGCPAGGGAFSLWGNGLVWVDCRAATSLNASCELSYNDSLIECTGSMYCGKTGFIDELQCFCARKCRPDLCPHGRECVDRITIPTVGGALSETACPPEELYNCACDPCANTTCPPSQCHVRITDSCLPGPTCCLESLCYDAEPSFPCPDRCDEEDVCPPKEGAMQTCIPNTDVIRASADACSLTDVRTCVLLPGKDLCGDGCGDGEYCVARAEDGCNDTSCATEKCVAKPLNCTGSHIEIRHGGTVYIDCKLATRPGSACQVYLKRDSPTCFGQVFCNGQTGKYENGLTCTCEQDCLDVECESRKLCTRPVLKAGENCDREAYSKCECDFCAQVSCGYGKYCTAKSKESVAPGACEEGECRDVCELMTCHPIDTRGKEVLCIEMSCSRGMCYSVERDDGSLCSSVDGDAGWCTQGQCQLQNSTPSCSCLGEGEHPKAFCSPKTCETSVCEITHRDGAVCTTDAMGTCDAGGCKARSPFTDDCTNSDCPQSQICHDPDHRVNGRRMCLCKRGMTSTPDNTCYVTHTHAPDSWWQMGVNTCDKLHKDVAVVWNMIVCQSRVCSSFPQPQCEYPEGCVGVDDPSPAADNCPYNPCAYSCSSNCESDETEKCVAASRSSGTLRRCRRNADGAQVCEKLPCPLPRCPAPAPGCASVPVVGKFKKMERLAHNGCPAFVCGQEVCAEECSPEIQAVCAAEKPRQRCVVIPVGVINYGKSDGDPQTPQFLANFSSQTSTILFLLKAVYQTCVPYDCPVVACTNPIPGCQYDPFPSAEPPVDIHGCLIFPCGVLNCTSEAGGCNDEQQAHCSQDFQDCIVSAGGLGACVSKPCRTERRACLASPGCYYESPTPVQMHVIPSCPASMCGRERCRPQRLCQSKVCKEGCVVFAARPYCTVQWLDPCQGVDCTDGETCVKTSLGVYCRKVDACDGVHCHSGLTCLSIHEKPVCVEEEDVPCNNECTEDEKCVYHADTMVYTCDPIVDTPCRDACACLGQPCGPGDACVANASLSMCFPSRSLPGLSASNADPCARVVCPSPQMCAVNNGRPECVQMRTTCVCRPSEVCDDDGGCLTRSDACILACGTVNGCVYSKGSFLCVREPDVVRSTHTCGDFVWPPKIGVCRTHDDCGLGEVCPALGAAAGGVSAWCSCDEGTGRPGLCSAALIAGVKYCVPRRWTCDEPIAVPARDAWCCEVLQTNCKSPTSDRHAYPCADDASHGPATWSPARLEYCSDLGRPNADQILTGEEAFDCFSAERPWPPAKAAYCCDAHNVSCPDLPGCDQPLADPPDQGRVAYCCARFGLLCPLLANPPWSCADVERWTDQSRRHCCASFGVGCPGGDDADLVSSCNDESADVLEAWSRSKRWHCCATASAGCLRDGDTNPEGPYDCGGVFAIQDATSMRRAWCCLHRGVGCLRDVVLRCEPRDLDDHPNPAVCCARTGRLCAYDCGYDAEFMDSEQKDFCCSVKGCDDLSWSPLYPPAQTHDKFMLSLLYPWSRVLENRKDFTLTFVATVVAALELGGASGFNVSVVKISPLDLSLNEVSMRDRMVPTTAWYSELEPRFEQATVAATILNPDIVVDRRRVARSTVSWARALYRPDLGPQHHQSALPMEGVEVIFIVECETDLCIDILSKATDDAIQGTGVWSQNLEGFTMAVVPIKKLVHDTRWPPPEDPPEEPIESIPPWIFALLSCGGLVVGLIPLCLFVRIFKRRPRQHPVLNDDGDGDGTHSCTSSYFYPLSRVSLDSKAGDFVVT